MSEDLSDKTVCICDNGLFFGLALKLCLKLNPDGFGKVIYHTPYEEDNPSFKEISLGDGFRRFGIFRSNDPLRYAMKHKVDLWVFPHLGFIGTQLMLEKMGERVVGAKEGQDLEVYRSRFRKLQADLGMDVPEYVIRTGISNLEKHLAPLEEKWIKIDQLRGDLETSKWRDAKRSTRLLEKLAFKFGPFKEQVPFMVEDNIKTDIEDGGDFLCVDGQLADHCIIGVEKKNEAYIGFIKEYSELDDQIKEAIEPLLPILKDVRYRHFISTEQRKTKQDNFLTDITTRLGFPSGSAQWQLYGNLPQLLYEAGAGNLIPIEPAYGVCLEVLLEPSCAEHDDQWFTMNVKPELWEWINPIDGVLNGDTLCVPKNDPSTGKYVASINGVGDDIEEAYEHLCQNLAMVEDQPVCYREDSIKDLINEIKLAEEHGIEFSDEPLPDAEELVAKNGE